MLSHLFLGMSLIGAEWVLYFLLLVSVLSIALILERALFYRQAGQGLVEFRRQIRQAAESGKWDEAIRAAQARSQAKNEGKAPDLESGLTSALLTRKHAGPQKPSVEILSEVAQDEVVRARLEWERNLAILATIGSNAPFVGLFGTVLGIIKAFHDLSQQAASGAQTVTAGMAEALIATAVGILVAIPAVVAFNLFQRKMKAALAQAESMKSFLIGKIAE